MAIAARRGMARQRQGRLVAGVCTGLSRAWRLDTSVVRFGFLALTLAAGVGVMVYAVAWAVLPLHDEATPEPATDTVDNVAAVAAVIGAVLVLRAAGVWFSDVVGLVGGLAAVGLTLVWGRAEGPGALAREGRGPLRVAVGVLLVLTGFVAFVALTGDLATLGRSLLGAIVVAVGIGLLAAPRLARLVGELDAERRARIRSEERAEIAAHLHDGVLQTLALVQRRAGDEREVVALARRQERELREWLYGEPAPGAMLASALAGELAIVEDTHRARVELVCVGDAPLDEPVLALIAAVREAATNAARHAGTGHVDVFVEVGDDGIDAFVRDRGRGFDPHAVPEDRRGLAESVVGRMQRAGGSARVTSRPGEGTEIALHLPRRR
jgi:signal transduction histidine kinase